MFWSDSKFRSTQKSSNAIQVVQDSKHDLVPSVTLVEHSSGPTTYKSAPDTTESDDLPFIEAETVADACQNGQLWVVIDDVIYDCTEFVHDHPGGSRVIEHFKGSNCTWQFWRFHSEKNMTEFGRSLRIGRTSGIRNKFKEPPRFVGLRKLWGTDA
ncbi:hypothetical protein FLONG3_395 [Fusarium longipes]|uniref:Cytochrome b5 heme-binding domain-containing protein n=1 Tax=Fusarium longipes TaxID=694270 RepID=A0A395TAB8_9HYPO|nr:hypothetical protein FLONG3_395 [Fusarium longipes]